MPAASRFRRSWPNKWFTSAHGWRLSHVTVWRVSLRLRPATLRHGSHAAESWHPYSRCLLAAAHGLALPATVGDPVRRRLGGGRASGLVVIGEGGVTIDAHDADLADVLAQFGARAGFRVRTSGSLGRVTATFTAVSVEQALRRLVQDHELMLLYSPASERERSPNAHPGGCLRSTLSAAQVRAASEMLGRQRAGLLAEINRLTRARNVEQGRLGWRNCWARLLTPSCARGPRRRSAR